MSKSRKKERRKSFIAFQLYLEYATAIMAIPNQKFREVVFLLLFSQDLVEEDVTQIVPLIMEQLEVTKKTVLDAKTRTNTIKEHLNKIDTLISEVSLSYDFERIQRIERNILRLGVFELLFDEAIPSKVAITEALRLTKKFGTPAATAFVNALLDSLYKKSKGEKTDEQAIKQSFADLQLSEDFSKNAPLPKE